MKTTNVISDGRATRSRGGRIGAAIIAIALGATALTISGCKKDSTTPGSLVADVTILNDSGVTIDIYVDGVIRSTVAHQASVTISSVTAGTHVFDFMLEDTQTVLQTEDLEASGGNSYYLTIFGPATIKVVNQVDEILRIIVDDVFIGDIGPNLTQTIYKVRIGEHILSAKRRSDGSDVASTTIDVVDASEYTWTISLE